MKRENKILLMLLFMFAFIIPTKVFGMTGEIVASADFAYKATVENRNGAKIYVSGDWCPDCGNYKAYTLEYGEKVEVIAEVYDYSGSIEKNCKEDICAFVMIRKSDLSGKKYTVNESEYKKLKDEAYEYDELSEDEMPEHFNDYLIKASDLLPIETIGFKKVGFGNFNEQVVVYGKSNVRLYKEPTIYSDVVTTLNKTVAFNNAGRKYYDCWYYVENGSTKGWLMIKNKNVYLQKLPSTILVTLSGEGGEYTNIEILNDITTKIGTKTYIIPKNKVFSEFYYGTLFDINENIVVAYDGNYFLVKDNEHKKCTNNSCTMNDIEIKVVEDNNEVIEPSVENNETELNNENTDNLDDSVNNENTSNPENTASNETSNTPESTTNSENKKTDNTMVILLSVIIGLLAIIFIFMIIFTKKKK